MDNNDFLFNQFDTGTYHATANLNTAIENPQFNVNSAVDVNVQGANSTNSYDSGNVGDYQNYTSDFGSSNGESASQYSSFENSYTASDSSQFVPSSSPEPSDATQSYQASDSNASYAPVMESHKKKTVEKPEMPSELRVTIIIGIVLLLFIFVVPYVYDFFKGMGLVFTRQCDNFVEIVIGSHNIFMNLITF